MSMSDDPHPRVEQKLEDHEEALDHHDRRISTNENYRLQVQGALKVLTGLASMGALGYALSVIGVL